MLHGEDLRKAQLLMLKLLKEIHRICEENGIKYFLCYGTLLGAVRHKGFIPWDDDCDIGMTREDYDKFLEVAKETLGSKFVLQTEDLDVGYGLEFSKIMLKDTIWIEKNVINNKKRVYNGIFVDVFPFDKIPNNKSKVKIQYILNNIAQLLILAKLNYTVITDSKKKKVVFIFFRIISKCISIKLLRNIRKSVRRKYNKTASVKYVNFDDYPKSIILYEDVFELKKLKFENNMFYVPKEYEKILSNIYGDYMVLPPEDKRVTHSIVEYDFGQY